jgi:predicted MFS family arabinose efflux permease
VRKSLKLPAYRRLLTAYTLNELAWSIGSVTLALFVYRQTGSAIGATAFFLCSLFVPALIAPALVARVDVVAPRWILPALYSLEAVLFAALAAIAHSFALPPVLILALVDGVIALAARALARAASVSVLTASGLLRDGNALMNAAFSVCFMAGPVIAGLIVAAAGTTAALLAVTALFAMIAFTLVTCTTLPASVSERHGHSRLRAALHYVSGQSAIRTLLSLQAAGIAFFSMSIPIEVVFAQETLGAGPRGYGGLLAAWGAGAVLGSLAFGRWRHVPSRNLISLGAAALGTGFAVMAVAPALGIALAGAALAGSGNGVEAVAMRTAVQENTEGHWMALVMSVQESVVQIAPGVGIVLGGAITAIADPRVALAVAAGGALAIAGLIRVVLRPGVLKETLA